MSRTPAKTKNVAIKKSQFIFKVDIYQQNVDNLKWLHAGVYKNLEQVDWFLEYEKLKKWRVYWMKT